MPDYGAVVNFTAANAQASAAASVIELPQKQTLTTRSWEPGLIFFAMAATSMTTSTARVTNRTGRTQVLSAA